MSYYTNVGTSITEKILAIKNELANRNKIPNYSEIEETIDLIEKQLNTLTNNYNKNLNQYSKITTITNNMRNAVVMKRDGILKTLKNLKEKNAAAIKIQAAARGMKNRKTAANLRMRANLTKRLNAILAQIDNTPRNNTMKPLS